MSAARGGRRSFGTDLRPSPGAGTFAFAAILCFGAVAAALFTQHRLGMQPCPWCVLQRLVFVAIGMVALLGLVWGRPGGRRLAAIVAVLLALGGFAAAMWQHFVAAATASCNLSLADRIVAATRLNEWLPDVFEARATCADAAVSLVGVPYEFWSATLFVVLAVTLGLALRRR